MKQQEQLVAAVKAKEDALQDSTPLYLTLTLSESLTLSSLTLTLSEDSLTLTLLGRFTGSRKGSCFLFGESCWETGVGDGRPPGYADVYAGQADES